MSSLGSAPRGRGCTVGAMRARSLVGSLLVGAAAVASGCAPGVDAEVTRGDAAVRDVVAPRDVIAPRDAVAPRDTVVARDVPAARDVVVIAPEDRPAVAPDDVEDLTPDLTPDGGAPVDVEAPTPTMGATMRVTASALNLRSGAGTTNMILTSMSCGAQVTVVGGPLNGWWNVRYQTFTGWASGAYLVADSAFDPSTCGGTTMTPPTPSTSPEVSRIFELSRSAVGYSYYWGHGSWGTDGTEHGSCSGSCPSCSHSGRYGADCSGFIAKVWQIPSASPVTVDRHPYSTYNFYNSTSHWNRVSRSAIRPGDALVYNSGSAGHIALFESGSDPWGSVWTYEARGCSYGIVHNLRTIASNYVAIRREGL